MVSCSWRECSPRYLQFGCGGFCGQITPTTFPACRTQLGGDFAIASTNDGHDAAGTDGLWAGHTEQPRIDFGYRAVHVVSIAAKRSRPPTTGKRRSARTSRAAQTAAARG